MKHFDLEPLPGKLCLDVLALRGDAIGMRLARIQFLQQPAAMTSLRGLEIAPLVNLLFFVSELECGPARSALNLLWSYAVHLDG